MVTEREMLHQLWAKQACSELCYKYCRALDRMDEALLGEVFHEDARYIHGEQSGSIRDFIAYAFDSLKSFDSTQHYISNPLITVEGEHATGEAAYMSYQCGSGAKGVGLGAYQRTDGAENVLVGGRYLDRFECIDGKWLIMERRNVRDWENWHAADARQILDLPSFARGARGRTDVSYLFS
jgi:hypothetical protein